MTKSKTDDQVMLDAFHTETVTGHSMGNFGAGGTGGSSSGGESGGGIAAETRYFTAVCNGCSFRGDATTERRTAQEQAHQHMVDYPGHTAFIEEKPAPA